MSSRLCVKWFKCGRSGARKKSVMTVSQLWLITGPAAPRPPSSKSREFLQHEKYNNITGCWGILLRSFRQPSLVPGCLIHSTETCCSPRVPGTICTSNVNIFFKCLEVGLVQRLLWLITFQQGQRIQVLTDWSMWRLIRAVKVQTACMTHRDKKLQFSVCHTSVIVVRVKKPVDHNKRQKLMTFLWVSCSRWGTLEERAAGMTFVG